MGVAAGARPATATALTQPLWRGEALNGRRLLVHAAEGLGDTLQFVRFLPGRRQTMARSCWRCRSRSSACWPVWPARTVCLRQARRPPATCTARCSACRIGSTGAGRSRRRALSERPTRLLCRSGNSASPSWTACALGSPGPATRGCAAGPAAFRPVGSPGAAGGGAWGQPGVAAEGWPDGSRRLAAGRGGERLDRGPRRFRRHRGAGAALDLVIAVDTAVAHLAGALGKPVWLMNRFDTCWRWLLDRDDSPWYPTLRQFRQPAPGAWDPVIAAVCEALSQAASGVRSCRRNQPGRHSMPSICRDRDRPPTCTASGRASPTRRSRPGGGRRTSRWLRSRNQAGRGGAGSARRRPDGVRRKPGQEARREIPRLARRFPALSLHIIGGLQTNKARDAVRLAEVIETPGPPRIADAIAAAIEKKGRRRRC